MTDDQKMNRRKFLLGTGAVVASAAAGSFAVLKFGGNGETYDFDLNSEIAAGKLNSTTSKAFGSDSYDSVEEGNYIKLKDAIDRSKTRDIADALKQDWAQKPDEPSKAIIAKAMAYTLSRGNEDLPVEKKEAILQTILKTAPIARGVRYITLNEVPEDHPDVVKPLAQLAKEGYVRDFPADKSGVIIQANEKLGASLETFIKTLPDASQGKGL